VAGRVDPASKLAGKGPTAPAPVVVVRPEASRRSTVLEVRTADRPGVLHLTLAALAALEITVCSAHVDTLGPQAVDVFYLQETGAGALPETRAAEAAHAVRSALDPR
jgi:[protein-PII] uridylyltransferase